MIKDLQGFEGPIDMDFMVKQATRATSNNGTSYLSIVLQDMSGTLDSKMWQITEADVETAQPGSIVRVMGIMGTYKGHPQLKINELSPVHEGDVDMSRFIPVAPVQIEKMLETLDERIASIEDADLRLLTKTILDKRRNAFSSYPAAVTVHHAYMGGLLYHSLSVLDLCLKAQETYPLLKKDFLIAGALLHDIGKTEELSGYKAASYTAEGNLLGHIALGAMIVEEEGKALNTPKEKLTYLIHMILSHHGELEFGSPKVPATPEALVLHCMDDIDAKMACLENYLNATEEGSFTVKIPWMQNAAFFKAGKLDK